MEFQREYYITSAPASATAGNVVLSPVPGLDNMPGDYVVNQITLAIAATSATTCAYFHGTHLASCRRFLVSFELK